ncbi:MAG: HAMP domain-containing histidine kinase [Oscillospiraceae bacterium]|nr:HAMP domain-containing histidine kinase [Oscillospiraceae bacterium]
MLKFTGLTRRWVMKTPGFISILLIVLTSLSCVLVYRYYYKTVSALLDSRDSNMLFSYFNLYSGSTDESFAVASREFLESFDARDKMSVWIFNKDGRVIMTSDGFEIGEEVPIPDYLSAVESKSGRGDFTGRIETGEKVMAMTVLLSPVADGSAAAIRYMISLQDIDHTIAGLIVMLLSLCLLMIFTTIFPGAVFLNKIAGAINNITDASNKISQGEFGEGICSYRFNDEIGSLQSAINNMVVEINAADRMKNDFISTISHELRTPLTAIKGWGETIQQIGESDPALTKRGVEVIISESSRLTGIVEELLDFSRIESGRMSLRMEKLDVLAELDETVFTFKERAIREGKELIYNVPNLPAPMNADSGRITQAFVNIIDNALKYTKQGGKIQIEAEMVEPSALEISVSDNGYGISEEDLPRVKEKFFKTAASVGGSGIGLAVADEIIKLHGGELLVNSILGTGTTVTVRLPIEELPVAG